MHHWYGLPETCCRVLFSGRALLQTYSKYHVSSVQRLWSPVNKIHVQWNGTLIYTQQQCVLIQRYLIVYADITLLYVQNIIPAPYTCNIIILCITVFCMVKLKLFITVLTWLYCVWHYTVYGEVDIILSKLKLTTTRGHLLQSWQVQDVHLTNWDYHREFNQIFN